MSKEGLQLEDETDDEKKSFEEAKKSLEPLCNKMKEVLKDGNIEKVVVSNRVVDSPSVLVTGEYGWSANMERIMKAQALSDSNGGMGMMMNGKKTMEINPDHSIIKSLHEKHSQDPNDNTVKDLIWMLFETSMLTSGFSLDKPTVFANRIHRLIQLGLGLDVSDDDEEEVPDVEEDDAVEDPDNEENDESTMEEVD